MRRAFQPSGFTLVELLVVITIIVVLLSLLTPTLDRAVNEAQLVGCLGNQHAIATAQWLYLQDSRQVYPGFDIWWDLLGDKGNGNYTDVTGRPLNVYLGYTADGSRVPVARCPSDIGDPGVDHNPANDILNTYKVAGSSYVQAFHVNGNGAEASPIAGVKSVYGYNGGGQRFNAQYAQYFTAYRGLKHTRLTRVDNKVLSLDWPWHPNRFTVEPRMRWHRNELVERIFSTLFADGHARELNMDKERVDPEFGGTQHPPDPSWKWW